MIRRLAGKIAGLPSVWNCKRSGEGSLGHSRKVLNWVFLEEPLWCLHSWFGTAGLMVPHVNTDLSRVRVTLEEMSSRC